MRIGKIPPTRVQRGARKPAWRSEIKQAKLASAKVWWTRQRLGQGNEERRRRKHATLY